MKGRRHAGKAIPKAQSRFLTPWEFRPARCRDCPYLAEVRGTIWQCRASFNGFGVISNGAVCKPRSCYGEPAGSCESASLVTKERNSPANGKVSGDLQCQRCGAQVLEDGRFRCHTCGYKECC